MLETVERKMPAGICGCVKLKSLNLVIPRAAFSRPARDLLSRLANFQGAHPLTVSMVPYIPGANGENQRATNGF